MTTESPHTGNLYLAIDQGGHASRSIVYDFEGRPLAQGHAELETLRPRKGWVEQDPEALLASIHQSVDRALAGLGGEAPARIRAAGLATQRSSIVCWDRETGAALSPVISWQDRRAHQWLRQFADQAEHIHRTTGLFLSAHYGASKLRWCLDHLPAVRQARDRGRLAMGPMAAFIVYRLLAGHPLLVDPANASRTLLWNLKQLDWDPALMDLFGLPQQAFPRCVPSIHEYGHLSVGGQEVPLRVVNGDQSAAMYALGAIQPDTAYINTGTGAFVSRSSGHYPHYGRRLLTGIVLQQDSRPTFVLEGTVNGAGSALDWIEKELGLGRVFDDLSAWLERAEAPPLFLNGVSGLGAPFWVPDFPSRFVGDGQPWEKVVAVVESILFLLQANMEEMKKLASPPQQIQISGGLAALDGLCQRLADLSGLPVYRPQEREATARGTAYLLAGLPAHWPETELGLWFKPRPHPALETRYRHWKEAMLAAMRKPK